jgi:hypothetical protein
VVSIAGIGEIRGALGSSAAVVGIEGGWARWRWWYLWPEFGSASLRVKGVGAS